MNENNGFHNVCCIDSSVLNILQSEYVDKLAMNIKYFSSSFLRNYKHSHD